MSESKSTKSLPKKSPAVAVAKTVDPASNPQAPPVPPSVPQAVPDHEAPSLLYVLQDHLIGLIILLLACLQYLLITLAGVADAIYNFLCKAYRVCSFAYHHPQATKELLHLTYQILKVSYDTGLWTWSDIWDILCKQLGKMSGPTPATAPTWSPVALLTGNTATAHKDSLRSKNPTPPAKEKSTGAVKKD